MMDQFSILEVFKALLGKAVTDLIYIAKVLLQAKDWRRGLTNFLPVNISMSLRFKELSAGPSAEKAAENFKRNFLL